MVSVCVFDWFWKDLLRRWPLHCIVLCCDSIHFKNLPRFFELVTGDLPLVPKCIWATAWTSGRKASTMRSNCHTSRVNSINFLQLPCFDDSEINTSWQNRINHNKLQTVTPSLGKRGLQKCPLLHKKSLEVQKPKHAPVKVRQWVTSQENGISFHALH